jgi:hypothetical protein
MKYRFWSTVLAVWLVVGATPVRAADDTTPHSKAFPILASTYAVLNGLDVYTTTRALQSGAGVEANPVMGPVAGNTVALAAVKSASTASTIYLARKLWKQHPKSAIVLLVCANVGMGIIVSHNATIAR